MSTKKKAVKKAVKAVIKSVVKKAAPLKEPPAGKLYDMATEVKDWIERATSTMNHLRGEVDRLKKENSDLKAYRTFAEHRILRSERE